MKHILNNLSEEEKNSIREQHTDKIMVETAKFRKLLGSKLGDVKPLTEQSSVPQNNAWNTLYKAINGVGTDEDMVQKGCSMITSPQVYQQVLASAKKQGHNTVMDYIMTDFQIPMVDKPIRTMRRNNPNLDNWADDPDAPTWQMFSKDKDTQVTKFCAKTLMKFNQNEWTTYMDKMDVDKPV